MGRLKDNRSKLHAASLHHFLQQLPSRNSLYKTNALAEVRGFILFFIFICLFFSFVGVRLESLRFGLELEVCLDLD